jgi:hypothetical protein
MIHLWHRQMDRPPTISTDCPAILEDALAGAECVVEEILLRHGHAIVIGQVRTIFASRRWAVASGVLAGRLS